jgi:long-chain acyl-CoA synthetase
MLFCALPSQEAEARATGPFGTRTLVRMFRDTVERHGHRPALSHKEGKATVTRTYAEMDREVRDFAAGLVKLGVTHGDRVAILSENCPEWALSDIAVLSLGAALATIYPTLTPPQVAYILRDSGARGVIVQDEKQLAKVLETRNETRDLEFVVVIEPPKGDLPEGVLTFRQVVELGRKTPLEDAEWDRRRDAVILEDTATLIYTSGTTGDPKGAVLTHRNFMANADMVNAVLNLESTDALLSFLPLSHVFERLAGHYLALSAGAHITYSQGASTLPAELQEVKPTVFFAAPRIWEFFQSRAEAALKKEPEKRQKIIAWAREVGLATMKAKFEGRSPGMVLGLKYAVADRLVLQKLRDRLGGRLQVIVSGSAALSRSTIEFMWSMGLVLLEGYGLTETSPVITVNRPWKAKVGTVGCAIPGVEVKLASDGEILTRSACVMKGYWNKPEATTEAIDPDGWFHTGDVGTMDADGFVAITDRKKDLLVLVTGKKVAPQPIETTLKSSPYIAEAALFGDKQSIVTALVVPDWAKLEAWAKEKDLPSERADLVGHAEARKLFKSEIDRLTAHLADFEKIRKFALLEKEFTQEGGELTPTLKVKRRVVAEKYRDVLVSLSGGEA